VVDEEALADPGAGVDLDARETAADVRDDPGEQTQVPAVESVGQAVELAGVEAGVGQDDLESAVSGRVSRLRCPDIASNAIQK